MFANLRDFTDVYGNKLEDIIKEKISAQKSLYHFDGWKLLYWQENIDQRLLL